MEKVSFVKINEDDDGMRLDRWLLKNYPSLNIGKVQKLLRSKQIKVDGKKAEANFRIAKDMEVRIPPIIEADVEKNNDDFVSDKDTKLIQSLVIHKDENVIVINKPSGLAVQGGTDTLRHIDGMLGALQFEKNERPKLVHRIDKNTSGILLLARNRKTAELLTTAFREHNLEKTYLALCVGVPKKNSGDIKMAIENKPAMTKYKVIETVGKFSLIEAEPLTGRTHQIRIHLKDIGCPILGDDKYFEGYKREKFSNLADKLHLHAYKIKILDLYLKAKLPEHFIQSLLTLGINFDE